MKNTKPEHKAECKEVYNERLVNAQPTFRLRNALAKRDKRTDVHPSWQVKLAEQSN